MKTQLHFVKSLLGILAIFLLATFSGSAQALPLTEDFSYTSGQTLAVNGWTSVSGTGTNNLTVSSSGLTYTGHPGSGVGKAVGISTTGDDNQKTFTAVTSGTVYMSALINITSAGTGDYFFTLSGGTTTFSSRLYAKSSGTGYMLGIEKSGTSPSYEGTARAFGTTYLIVIKYTIVAGTTNDTVGLFIEPALGGSEPGSATLSAPTTGTDPTSITGVTIRQGSSTPVGTLDAIRIGTTWASVTASASVPTITLSATATTALTTTYGTASTSQSFTVSGTNLSANVTVGALAGFEFSKDNSTFSTTLSYAPTSGTLSSSNFYARLAASATPGSYNSKAITFSTTSGTDKTITTPSTGNTVSAKSVTITGVTASNKIYDRTNTASLNTGSAAVSGVVGSDVVTVTAGTATFASTGVANGIAVTATGFALGGANAANYTLSAQPAGLSANISQKALTVSSPAGVNKVYNRNNAATFTGSLSGIISPDVVTLSATGTFASANVANGIGITSTATLGGADLGNYSLTQPTGLSANITAKALTVTGAAGVDKTYDGTTDATFTGTLSGIISPDVVTLNGTGTFASEAVANNVAITSTATLGGADAGNYSLTQPTGLTANINSPAAVSQTITFGSLSAVTYGDSSFNLTATASSGLTVSYNSSNTAVATISGNTVTIVGAGSTTITASQAGGVADPFTYNAAVNVTQNLTVNAKSLTLNGATAQAKEYDRTNAATITGTLTGVVGSDDVSFVGSGSFASVNASTSAIGVTASISLTGTKAANYSFTTQPTGLSALINKKTLTPSSMTATKVYDGNANVTITGTSLTGVISPDVVTVSGSGTFSQTAVGSSLAVSYSLSLSGADAGNYSINNSSLPTVTGSITAAPLTISGISIASKSYDGTTAATIQGTAVLNGIVSGDTVTVAGTPVAVFTTAAVGTDKAVTVSGYDIAGADATNYAVLQPTALTGTVTKGNQTITFNAIASKNTSDAAFNPGATASSGLTVTYVSSNTAVATVSGSNITIVGAGTSTITASQAGDTNYNAATSVNQTLTVTAAPYTDGRLVVARVASTSTTTAAISFDEYSTSGATGTTYTLPVTTSGNINRVTISGGSATEGQLLLSADGQYLTFGGYDVAAGGTAGGNRVIARVDYKGNVATTSFSSATHTVLRSVATANGKAYYTSGSTSGVGYIQHAGNTTAVTPAFAFTGTTNLRSVGIYNNKLYYGTGSSPTGIYRIPGTSLPTSTVSSSTAAMTGTTPSPDPYGFYMVNRGGSNWNCYVAYGTNAGIYKFSSTDGGDTWTARGSVTHTAGIIGIVAQVNGSNVDVYATTSTTIIKLTDTAAYNATMTGTISTLKTVASGSVYRGLAFAPKLIAPVVTNSTLTATGTVDASFTSYTVTADNAPDIFGATGLPAGLTINATTGVISGTPTVAGDFNVTLTSSNSAGSDSTKTLAISIAKANQSITFGTISTKDISQVTTFNLAATSATSAVNTITYTSSNTDVATIVGSTVTLVGTGTTVITASQAGNDNYFAASDVTQPLNVIDSSKTDQTITFDALSAVSYGDDTFNLGATSTSGLAISYISSNTSVATINGNTVTIVGPGTSTITSFQSGNAQYNPAANVTQILTVNKKQLTVTGATVAIKAYDGTNIANITGASLSGIVGSDVVTLSGGGIYNDVNAATGIAITTSFTLGGANAGKYTLQQPTITGDIVKASQTISFTAFTTKTLLDPDFAPTATSATSATNAIYFTSSDTSVASIATGGLIHIEGIGTTTITAVQAESQNYSFTSATQVLTVARALYLNQFTGTAACPTQGNTPVAATNVTGAAASRSTITCSTTANLMNSTTLNNTGTVSNTSYIEFSAAAAAGYAMRISSISFGRSGSNTAPNQVEVRYSTDNFATSTSWGAAPLTTTTLAVANWDFTDFTTPIAGTVTFRVYPYGTQRADLAGGTASATGTFRLDDFTIYGLVVTAPTAAALSGTNTICNGSSTNLAVNITGGTAPYTVVLSNGTTTIAPVTNYTSTYPFAVSPTTSTTYTLSSVTDAYGLAVATGGLSGSSYVGVNANVTYYRDNDFDTYGDATTTQVSCFGTPSGYVANNTDCDDTRSAVYPGATEICGNGIDDNCDGRIDEVCSTQVQTAQCGTTVSSLTTPIYADAVSVAQAYRFEVSDGTTTATYDSTTNYFNLSYISGVKFAALYTVRVAIKFQGVWQGYYGNTCTVTSPTTSLQSSYCGATILQPSSPLFANPVTGASGYRFQVTNGSTVRTYDSSSNSFSLSNLNGGGASYGTAYAVRVAPIYSGVVYQYGASCTVTIRQIPTTSLLTSVCGTTLASIETSLYCTAVDTATSYEFEVTNNTTNATSSVTSSTSAFNLTQLTSGAAYSTSYSVRVNAFANGSWTGFGSACVVTTPAPVTAIAAPTCGSTLASLYTTIYAGSLNYISGYRFEVTVGSNVRTFDASTNAFNLMQLSGGAAYNTTYSVRVAVVYNGTLQSYGAACTFTTPAQATPTTALNPSQCGVSLSSFWTTLYSGQIAGATGYSFLVTWGVSNSATITRSTNNFNLMLLPGGASAGTTYTIQVAPIFSSGTGTYGTPCTVTTGSHKQQVVYNNDFSAYAYPNPFEGSFTLALDTPSAEPVSILVYDMLGKVVVQGSYNPADLAQTNFGAELPAGVYNVFIQQADENRVVRVIKR